MIFLVEGIYKEVLRMSICYSASCQTYSTYAEVSAWMMGKPVWCPRILSKANI